MKEDQIEIFDKYMSNSLDEEAKKEFVQRIKDDKDFAMEYQFYHELKKGIGLSENLAQMTEEELLFAYHQKELDPKTSQRVRAKINEDKSFRQMSKETEWALKVMAMEPDLEVVKRIKDVQRNLVQEKKSSPTAEISRKQPLRIPIGKTSKRYLMVIAASIAAAILVLNSLFFSESIDTLVAASTENPSLWVSDEIEYLKALPFQDNYAKPESEKRISSIIAAYEFLESRNYKKAIEGLQSFIYSLGEDEWRPALAYAQSILNLRQPEKELLTEAREILETMMDQDIALETYPDEIRWSLAISYLREGLIPERAHGILMDLIKGNGPYRDSAEKLKLKHFPNK